jgi:SAM-dependent methyltransferase
MTSQPGQNETALVSAGYDAVYAASAGSPTLRRLWHEHAEGADFPEEFGHISFTTLAQLRQMARELRLSPGNVLADLACGMAGPALWLARETGARLIGVDLSAVAVDLAAARAGKLGVPAEFRVGSFADTGLQAGSVDGVTSEDALQYAPDKAAALSEIARILRPGGRFVFVAFELEPTRVQAMPVLNIDPVEDYRPGLEKAGFTVDVYEETAGWDEQVTGTYSSIVEAQEQLTAEMGAVAIAALLSEVTMTLQARPYRRRVLAAATRNA